MASALPSTSVVTVTVTPSKLDLYQRCPASYHALSGAPYHAETSEAQDRGQYLHDLLCRYNRGLIAGSEPTTDSLIAGTPLPWRFRDGGEQEAAIIDYAQGSIAGYASFLRDEEVVSMLAAEQYVKTVPRPVTGSPGARIIFSGRFDAIAKRRDGAMLCIDLKSGALRVADDLRQLGSTFVYSLLVQFEYLVEDVEIIHVVPHDLRWVRVRPQASDREQGAALCRSLVADSVAQQFGTQPGEHCAWCRAAEACPAVQRKPSRPGWDQPI
jgi:RecB family exonuclease